MMEFQLVLYMWCFACLHLAIATQQQDSEIQEQDTSITDAFCDLSETCEQFQDVLARLAQLELDNESQNIEINSLRSTNEEYVAEIDKVKSNLSSIIEQIHTLQQGELCFLGLFYQKVLKDDVTQRPECATVLSHNIKVALN